MASALNASCTHRLPTRSVPRPLPPGQDLESRKRAPLYQKKQEEELKAAQDKAAEAEVGGRQGGVGGRVAS